jgi:hypothetical protein
VNTFPLFGHPPARSVRWWMFDVLVTVLAALFSLPDLAQEHVTPTLPAVLVQVTLILPLVVRRVCRARCSVSSSESRRWQDC